MKEFPEICLKIVRLELFNQKLDNSAGGNMSEISIEFTNSTGNRTSVLKDYYARYLIEIKGVKQSTVRHYYDALNNISRRLKEKGLIKENIYEVKDLEQLHALRDILYADPDFTEMNERGRRMYSAGLNNYCKFASGEELLMTKESVEKMDIPLMPEEPIIVEQTVWKRSNILRMQALTVANYACEINKRHESFIAENTQKPYMEGHHAIPMKFQTSFDKNLDVYANIICLCPICHRKIHYGQKAERVKMIHQIYEERSERLEHSGISLSRDEFTEIATQNRAG